MSRLVISQCDQAYSFFQVGTGPTIFFAPGNPVTLTFSSPKIGSDALSRTNDVPSEKSVQSDVLM